MRNGILAGYSLDWPRLCHQVRFVFMDEVHTHKPRDLGSPYNFGCCKAVLRTCFEQLHLERVILQIAVNNKKSRQVAKRMGMRLEGSMEDKWKKLLRLEGMSGPYACALQFSISCSEWRSQMKTELD